MLNTIALTVACLGVVGVIWVAFGYSLAFGPDAGGGLIGTLSQAGLHNMATQLTGPAGHRIPVFALASFELMFAIITVALLAGAVAERTRFWPWLVFVALLATTAVNAAGANGLLYGGGFTQLGRQALAALITIAYSGLLTLAIAALVQKTIGLRATREAELTGIDEAEHAETAYDHGRFAAHHTGLAAMARAHGGRDETAKPPAALPRTARPADAARPPGCRA
jgi:ammonia channel protein AmtB